MDIDVSKRLLESILASLKNEKKGINFSFFVSITYEKLPRYCGVCRALGHDDSDCYEENNYE